MGAAAWMALLPIQARAEWAASPTVVASNAHGAVAAALHGSVRRFQEDGEVAVQQPAVVPHQPAQPALDGFHFLMVVEHEGDVLARFRAAVEH